MFFLKVTEILSANTILFLSYRQSNTKTDKQKHIMDRKTLIIV